MSNEFDRLVTNIDQDERMKMLKRIESIPTTVTESFAPAIEEKSVEKTIEIKLEKESFFLKIILYIKSLFASSDLLTEYNSFLLQKKAKEIEAKYPEVVNYKKGVLGPAFYFQLNELRKSIDFFQAPISLFEEDNGRFYAYLSCFLLPEFTAKLDAFFEFSGVTFNSEKPNELRTSLLRQLENMLKEVTAAEKAKMYGAIKNINWVQNLTSFPAKRFINRFSEFQGVGFTCPMDSSRQDVELLAQLLCNITPMHREVVEALATFSVNERPSEGTSSEAIEQKRSEMIGKAVEAVDAISRFTNAIPIRSVASLTSRALFSDFEQLGGVEDWFSRFRAFWRQKFDTYWNEWVRQNHDEDIKRQVKNLLSTSTFPMLPYRPWEGIVDDKFKHELSMGFLYAFYQKNYVSYNKNLRILMSEGEFVMRENRLEFTDTYSELNRVGISIAQFAEGLAPDAERGGVFSKIASNEMRTIQGWGHLDSLIFSLDSEAVMLLTTFFSACEKLSLILGAIVDEVKDPRYGTLQNLSMIQGKSNAHYRMQLRKDRHAFVKAVELLQNLQRIDNE